MNECHTSFAVRHRTRVLQRLLCGKCLHSTTNGLGFQSPAAHQLQRSSTPIIFARRPFNSVRFIHWQCGPSLPAV